MTELSDLVGWIAARGITGAGIGLLCALVTGATAQLLAAAARAPRRRRPLAWRRAGLTVTGAMLAGWLAAGIDGGLDTILTAAFACAAAVAVGFFERRDLTRRLGQIALVGCATGAATLAGALPRYVVSRTPASVLTRFELCGAVFLGALIFAGCAIALARLRGVLGKRHIAPAALRLQPFHVPLLDAVALALCAWLAYGFITESAAPDGAAALLAMGALAAALGVHLTMAFDGWPAHALTARALRASVRSCGGKGALRDDTNGRRQGGGAEAGAHAASVTAANTTGWFDWDPFANASGAGIDAARERRQWAVPSGAAPLNGAPRRNRRAAISRQPAACARERTRPCD